MPDNDSPAPAVTSSNTISEPWSGVQSTLKKANELALNNVSADTFKPSDTSTVVDQSAETLSSMDMLRNQANAGVLGLGQAQTQAQSVIDKGGVDSALTSQYGDLRGGTLGDFASGNMMGGNPYLMKSLEQGADQISQNVNESAAGMGRYGSGTHQKVLGDSVGNYYNNALTQDYQNSVNNMMQANNQSGALLGQQIGNEMQGDSLAMQAGQGLGNLYQTGSMPASTLGQVGTQVEDQNRMVLQDQLDKESANKTAGLNYSQYLNAIGSGAGAFGSTTSTAQTPTQSTPAWQQGLYGASAVAGLGNSFGLWG